MNISEIGNLTVDCFLNCKNKSWGTETELNTAWVGASITMLSLVVLFHPTISKGINAAKKTFQKKEVLEDLESQSNANSESLKGRMTTAALMLMGTTMTLTSIAHKYLLDYAISDNCTDVCVSFRNAIIEK